MQKRGAFMEEENKIENPEEKKEQVKCSKCGKEIDPSYKVCPYCGKKVNEESETRNWPIVGVTAFLGSAQFFIFIGTILALWSSIQSGAIMMFLGGFIQLGSIPFGAIALKDSKHKKKAIILFVLLCALTFLTFLSGIFWISIF